MLPKISACILDIWVPIKFSRLSLSLLASSVRCCSHPINNYFSAMKWFCWKICYLSCKSSLKIIIWKRCEHTHSREVTLINSQIQHIELTLTRNEWDVKFSAEIFHHWAHTFLSSIVLKSNFHRVSIALAPKITYPLYVAMHTIVQTNRRCLYRDLI